MSTALSERFDVISSRRRATAYPTLVSIIRPAIGKLIVCELNYRGSEFSCLAFRCVSSPRLRTFLSEVFEIFAATFRVLYPIKPLVLYAPLTIVLLPGQSVSTHTHLAPALQPIASKPMLVELRRIFCFLTQRTAFQTIPPDRKS